MSPLYLRGVPVLGFHILALVNNAALNMGMQMSRDPVFSTFGCSSRSGIARSYYLVKFLKISCSDLLFSQKRSLKNQPFEQAQLPAL